MNNSTTQGSAAPDVTRSTETVQVYLWYCEDCPAPTSYTLTNVPTDGIGSEGGGSIRGRCFDVIDHNVRNAGHNPDCPTDWGIGGGEEPALGADVKNYTDLEAAYDQSHETKGAHS